MEDGKSVSTASSPGHLGLLSNGDRHVKMAEEPVAQYRCPICGRPVADACWMGERRQFLIECPQCTTFTITAPLAARFRCALHPEERQLVDRLSRYLRDANDDDDREITESSWIGLAAEAED